MSPSKFRGCFRPAQWWWVARDFDEEGTLVWVYREIPPDASLAGDRYQVGYYMPDRSWFADGTFPSKDEAAARVNYLNGGIG